MTPLEQLQQSLASFRSSRPSADTVARWRATGCCTECGNPVTGAEPIGEQGVVFFGKPHQAEDLICFWCMDRWCLEPDEPSRFSSGRA